MYTDFDVRLIRIVPVLGKLNDTSKKRIAEHQRSGSAIYVHSRDCNTCSENTQEFQGSFTVLDKGNSDFDLKILEALEITENRPSLNKQLVNNGAFYVLNIF